MTLGRAAFVTYGCKLNQYDTQAIREEVLALGYEESAEERDLDVVVVNSCTVTARAGQKVESRVKAIAKKNPAAKILVTGCLTEEDRNRLKEIPAVEHLVGNEEKDQIPEILFGHRIPGEEKRRRADRSIFDMGVTHFSGRTRAFLKVQDGCDSFCSYCVIPYLRGASRSRTPQSVVAEAAKLAAAGHREIVLTGIHLRQYAIDLDEEEGLVELLVQLRQLEGIDRVRLSSIGERAFTDRFVSLFQKDSGLCPSFHIPLQSGSDRVLGRMRRDYTAQDFLDTIERIRRDLPRATICTDLMVGFPGESEEDFADSLDVCQRSRFLHVHCFPFSPRPRTRAARMTDQVARETIERRMSEARGLASKIGQQERDSRVGDVVQVLLERVDEEAPCGLSREGLKVSVTVSKSDNLLRGDEVSVELTGVRGANMIGVPLQRFADHKVHND